MLRFECYAYTKKDNTANYLLGVRILLNHYFLLYQLSEFSKDGNHRHFGERS